MEDSGHAQITVREARSTDASALVALNRFVQHVHTEARPDRFRSVDDMPGIVKHYRRLHESPDHTILVAEVSGTPVGYALVELQRRPPNPFTHGFFRLYVDQISVDPARRRRGIGRALMKAVERLARELGADAVTLDTWSFNRGARRFFEALDFSPTNVRYEKTVAEAARPPADPEGEGGGT